jgi:ABC-type glycerol-3-phosphate transport system substrate-binding protein
MTGAVALATAACGGSQGSAGAGKELTYWSMWKDGEPQAIVLKQAIDQFTKDTGIKVKVEWKGRNVAEQLAPTLNTSSVPADLIDSQDRFVKSTFFDTKQGLNLNPVYGMAIPGEGKKVADVIPAKYRDFSTANGNSWLVPYEVLTEQIWYDGAALPDVTAAPPRTWDEFVALLDKRKAARGGAGPLALDGDIGDYNAFWTYYAILRELGPGAFGAAAADKSGAKFDDPRMLTAVSRIEQLVKGGDFIKGYNGSKWPAIQQKWAAGDADFLLLGTFVPSETKAAAKAGFQYRSFPVPATTAGGDASQEIALIGFAIPAKAKHSAAAEQFIAYFLNRDRLSSLATTSNNITARPDVEVPAVLADAKKALDSSHTVPALDGVKMDNAQWYTKVFVPANNEFLAGKLSAANLLSTLKKTSIDFWKING